VSRGKRSSEPAAEAQSLLAALEQLRTAGRFTKASIDKALGRERGYYGHLRAGRIVLTVEHVYAILKALEVDAGAFFGALHPSPAQGSEVDALRSTFLEAERLADRSAWRYLAGQLRAKGVLDDEDAQELLRRLEER
jgi:hypothetical protein